MLWDPPVRPPTVARTEDGMLHPSRAAAVRLPPAWLEDASSAELEDGFHPPDAGGRGGTPAHAKAGPGSPPAPARMMKILEAEGEVEAAARLASPHHRTGGHPPV
jgi:hypothetical protein